MKISGTNGINPQMSNGNKVSQSTDSFSKNIQRQISNAQKQLQELSSNEEMSVEEKMKKRQEIQKQITGLNHQLRQHQLEQRKEKQQETKSSMEDMLGGTSQAGKKKSDTQRTGFSQAGMQAIISGDSAMKQAKVQGSTAVKMEGRAGVLEAEIKQDAALGGDTKAKEEELAKTIETVNQATASQINTLAEANRKLEEAEKADPSTEKAEGEKEDKKSSLKGAAGSVENPDAEDTQDEVQAPVNYVSVDIRL